MNTQIFSERVEGFDALADKRQGKITFRTHKVHLNKLAPLTADEVVAVRQQLNLSRSVFAMYLRTNSRTLENWEQGRATGRDPDSAGGALSGNGGATRGPGVKALVSGLVVVSGLAPRWAAKQPQ